MKVVEVNSIRKTYSKENVVALDNISFEVEKAELFGIIGPDGAGKTSLFRILTTLLAPDSGDASVEGFNIKKDINAIRSRVGYMPGRFSLYQDLTVLENLQFFATLFGTSIEENYQLIKSIYDQIKPFNNRRAGKLSGGMKQKLALCCALIHSPALLFLDEPTTGVDVVSRREFWDMLKELKTQGITILVSTPYMDEAMRCERIALMQTGKIMKIDTPSNIITAFSNELYAVKADNIYQLLLDLRQSEQVATAYPFGEFLHVTLKSGDPEAIKQLATAKGHEDVDIRKIEPTIEDTFMYLMNQTNNKPLTAA